MYPEDPVLGMSRSNGAGNASIGAWSVVGRHDWDGTGTLETTLRDALDGFDAETDDVLYRYVDVEALVDALSPDADRGASEVRFDYGRHEVRVSRDGTVAVR